MTTMYHVSDNENCGISDVVSRVKVILAYQPKMKQKLSQKILFP